LNRIIDFSLRNRVLVILATIAAGGAGLLALRQLDIDAFPDTTPVQVQIIPANPKANEYAQDTARLLKDAGVRVEVDLREEKMGAKIRDAELLKIPYMLVVGPREAEAGTVSPRRKGAGQLETMTRQAFLERVLKEVRERA